MEIITSSILDSERNQDLLVAEQTGNHERFAWRVASWQNESQETMFMKAPDVQKG